MLCALSPVLIATSAPSHARDPYEVLGVQHGATLAEIKRAYRTQALQWHPDTCQQPAAECEKRFIEVAAAYSILGDETRRRDFDAPGSSPDFSANVNVDLQEAFEMFESFMNRIEEVINDRDTLDAYVDGWFKGADNESWTAWGLKKAVKWGIHAFGQTILDGIKNATASVNFTARRAGDLRRKRARKRPKKAARNAGKRADRRRHGPDGDL